MSQSVNQEVHVTYHAKTSTCVSQRGSQLGKDSNVPHGMTTTTVNLKLSVSYERRENNWDEPNGNINPDRRSMPPKSFANKNRQTTDDTQKHVQHEEKTNIGIDKLLSLTNTLTRCKNLLKRIPFQNTNKRVDKYGQPQKVRDSRQEGFQKRKKRSSVARVLEFVFRILFLLNKKMDFPIDRKLKDSKWNNNLERCLLSPMFLENGNPQFAVQQGQQADLEIEGKGTGFTKSKNKSFTRNLDWSLMIWIMVTLLLLLLYTYACSVVIVEIGLQEKVTMGHRSLALENETSISEKMFSPQETSVISSYFYFPVDGNAAPSLLRPCCMDEMIEWNNDYQVRAILLLDHATLPSLKKEAAKAKFVKHRISKRARQEQIWNFKTDIDLHFLNRNVWEELVWVFVFVMPMFKIINLIGGTIRKHGWKVYKYALIISILIQGGDGCLASINTSRIVKECPKNIEEWRESERTKGCEQIFQTCASPFKFKYHCLLNEWGNETIEVCAEVRNIVCHCPEYNSGAGIVQNNLLRPFPFPHENCSYPSNTLMESAKLCYDWYIEETSTSPNMIADTTDTGNKIDNQTDGTTSNMNASNENPNFITILSPILGVAFIVCTIVMICICKKCGRTSEVRGDHTEHKEDPLLDPDKMISLEQL